MEKYYTVEKVSELLKMHPKTIRKYIREGKLNANKVGKEWRISGHSVSLFIEGVGWNENTPTKHTQINKITISSVIDINVSDSDEAIRIINILTAALNMKPIEYGKSTMSSQFIEAESKVRVMLWGTISFIEVMLASIKNITE